ncbi:MAG: threonine--tRNA ligase [Alphaproteobacteria bacterium]|nr:threonine--tRNA ligase [Alphaproteobacteria bacterium]MBN2780327.1 threonine--tRNA ligase [Alphaproteobacteria bacterium]
MIKISFPDGSQKEYNKGVSAFKIAQSISPSLAKSALYAKVDGKYWDLTRPLEKDCVLQLLTLKDAEALPLMRHSLAHVLAQALKEIWPDSKPVIGPDVADGFYYDFDLEHHITPEDFSIIEDKIKEILKRGDKVERLVLSRDEAISLFEDLEEPYKVENVNAVPEGEEITVYKQGSFTDLCRGPHVPSTSLLPKSFKIARVAGAYLGGDSKNKMLQRVYVYAFADKEALEAYIYMLEEAKKRDHRKLGKELDLFHFEPDFAPGAVFWHPLGWKIYRLLINYIREKQDVSGYVEVETPRLMDRSLWEKSGHWEKYGEHNYAGKTEDERMFCVKPMNCPGHMLTYANGLYSHKDMPLKMAEFGKVNRYEASGALHGLLRVREFTQDDAHVFCRENQIESETVELIKFILGIYKDFGFEDVRIKLSTRPEQRIGDDKVWDITEDALRKALEKNNYTYTINEGEGAFYGPKLEFVLRDSIGRDWQCGTVQVDMSLPERFDLNYIDEEGEKIRPVMIHRALLGSVERFMGILIEHYAGKFPTWLAPVQVMVVPVSDKHVDYAQKVYDQLFYADVKTATSGLRVEMDSSAERMQKKLRNATLRKIPYMLIIGDQEVESKTVSLRTRDGKQENGLKLEDVIARLKANIESRTQDCESI